MGWERLGDTDRGLVGGVPGLQLRSRLDTEYRDCETESGGLVWCVLDGCAEGWRARRGGSDV